MGSLIHPWPMSGSGRTLRVGGFALAIASSVLLGAFAIDAAPNKTSDAKTKTASLNPAPNKSNSTLTTVPKKLIAPKGCMAGMAPIPSETGGFCIDRYEAGVVELLPKGKIKAHSPFTPVTNMKVRAIVKKGITPQGYISQLEAKDACENAGKRLCTTDEWMRACQGKQPTKYPYGDDEIPGRCNGDGTRPHPVVELFGTTPDPFADSNKMNDPRINALPGTLAKTGAKAKCTNTYGVFDMVGNVHEWTADPGGSFKGGYYMDTHQNGDGCFYITTAHGPSYHDYSTGFRCCK
jgi:formylglycine-generating enzyme